jgi:nicotinate-nucleotide adenylyltransferase
MREDQFAPGERIGLLGGTFDPIHVGHLVSALDVRHRLGLDRVLFVVANEPWQKVGARNGISPPEDRLALVEAAVASLEGLEASAVELERGGTSYTIDTVEELLQRSPGLAIHLLVGSDVAASLHTWHRVEDLMKLVTLVVMERAGFPAPMDLTGWRREVVRVPALGVSSSEIRQRISEGMPVDLLVPDAAIRLMRARGMYARCR